MEELRSYVVRVYRQESEEVAGVVESVAVGTITPFRTPDELWAAVCHDPAARRRWSIDNQKENGQ